MMKQHLRSLKSTLRNHPLLHPTSFLKASIWILGLSLLIYRSSKEFLDLLYEYTDRNLATEIAVVSSTPIRPSNMTVCIPYYSGSLSKLEEQIKSIHLNKSIVDDSNVFLEWNALRNRSWDVWTHPDFDRSSPQLVTFFMERIVGELNFEVLQLNRSNFNWNQPILDAVWQFLSCWHNRDLTYLHPPNPDILQMFNNSCWNVNFTRIGHLSRRSIDRLVDASIRAFDIYSRVIIQFPPDLRDTYVSITDRLKVFKLAGGNLCVPLLSNSTAEMFVYRPPNFDDAQLPPWKRYPRTTPFQIWPDDTPLYGAPYLVQALYTTDFATLPNLSAEIAYYSYGIDSIVRETRPEMTCNEDFASSFSYCLAIRQIKHVKRVCGCVPFVYRYLDTMDAEDDLPYCDSESYGNCSTNLLATFDRYSDECTNRCTYVFYKWRHYLDTRNVWNDRSFGFRAWITPSNREPFVEFSLTAKSTWAQFISQIGGVVNFYLGFSGLTICGIIIVCVDVIGAFVRMRMHRNRVVAREEVRGEDRRRLESISGRIAQSTKPTRGDWMKESEGRRWRVMEERMGAFDDKLERIVKILDTMRK